MSRLSQKPPTASRTATAAIMRYPGTVLVKILEKRD
jgi:hypothetical protein